MNISGLFSYQDRLNQLLNRMDKALVVEFNCSIDIYDGIVTVDHIQCNAAQVNSVGMIQQELLSQGVDSDLVAEIIVELEYAEIDIKSKGDFPASRWNVLDVVDDDKYRVTCSFLLEIADL